MTEPEEYQWFYKDRKQMTMNLDGSFWLLQNVMFFFSDCCFLRITSGAVLQTFTSKLRGIDAKATAASRGRRRITG